MVDPNGVSDSSVHISIAMCTYNGARFLGEQLQSIAAQRLQPDELVVCDDRSSDETTNIVRGFAERANFSVRLVVNEQTLGPAKNFEKAIALCQGRLIALSDQDDNWSPEKLLRLSRILEQDETLGGVFSNAYLMNENSARSGARLWERVRYRPQNDALHAEKSLATSLLKADVVTGATLMIRAKVRDLLLPVPDCWMHDGWFAWMLALYSGIAAVDEPLISYRIHDMQHAGLSPRSLKSRIEYARRTGKAQCLPTASRFEQLRAHWIEKPGGDFERRLYQMEQKIAHLRYRLNLPSGFVKRVYSVTSAYRLYQLYSSGAATMWKDILLG